jgi:hypothetical protein
MLWLQACAHYDVAVFMPTYETGNRIIIIKHDFGQVY